MPAPTLTEQTWLITLPMIQDTLHLLNGTHDLADLVKDILDGKLQVWATGKSFALTEINQFPKKRELLVVLMGGDMDDLMTIEAQLVEFAKEKGCDWVSGFGRMGFNRKAVWADAGWKPTRVCYLKELAA